MKKTSIIISTLFLAGAVFIIPSCKKDGLKSTKENLQPIASEFSSCNTEEAYPNQKGVIKQITVDGIELQYEEINGDAIFQGDILLDIEGLKKAQENRGAGKRLLGARWPNNTVYYTIGAGLSGDARITDAIKTWRDNTEINFVPRTTQKNYVTFIDGDGCRSSIGMIGGQQFIIMGSGCSTGNIRHEIGHAIGLFHEHTRADRGGYVTIHWDEIKPEKEGNFKLYDDGGNSGFDQGAMDFESIMLYDSYAFAKGSKPTITRLNGTTFTSQRNVLSAGDLTTINMMYPKNWRQLPGAAMDIGASAGATYVIGTNIVAGGYGIYKWNGSSWTNISGGAVRVDVENNGTPWVVNSYGEIFKREGNVWKKLPGKAKDIGIGAEGSVYVIGTNAVAGGYGIYKWNGSSWTKISGGAVRITVDNTGTPWVINSAGNIYKRNGNSWSVMPGSGRDIGAGANGSVFVIGNKVVGGGHSIHQWSGSDWVEVPGGAEFVDVGTGGSPWVVNNGNNIYKKI